MVAARALERGSSRPRRSSRPRWRERSSGAASTDRARRGYRWQFDDWWAFHSVRQRDRGVSHAGHDNLNGQHRSPGQRGHGDQGIRRHHRVFIFYLLFDPTIFRKEAAFTHFLIASSARIPYAASFLFIRDTLGRVPVFFASPLQRNSLTRFVLTFTLPLSLRLDIFSIKGNRNNSPT